MQTYHTQQSRPAWRRVRGHLARIARDLMGTVTQVRTEAALVALTFDDGPHPEYTPRLLDILARHQARATLFMVGRYAERYPRIVARAAAEGHALCNHSYSHTQFPLLRPGERLAELRRCQEALAPHGLRLFRPPFGRQTRASRFDLLRAGYQAVAWSVHAEDWELREAAWMAARLEREIEPGSIVLLHDAIRNSLFPGAEDREATLQAVDMLLTRLGGRYRFVTVPDLMLQGRVVRNPWYQEPIPVTQFQDSRAAQA
jgi:peptidoglycan/xylan/chitin deacetylase (PgdA/CDA1 family)